MDTPSRKYHPQRALSWSLAFLLLQPGPPLEGPAEELEWEELGDPDGPDEPLDRDSPEKPESGAEPTPDSEPEPAPTPAPAPAPEPEPAPEEQEDGDAVDLQPAATSARVAEPTAGPLRRPRRVTYPKTWFNVSFGVGASWFAIGFGLHYFFIPHLAIGGEIRDEIYISKPTFNEFNVTPIVTFLALPRLRFTPLLRAGFGGEFISHGGGSYGRWLAGAAFLVRLTRRWTLDVGLDVTGNVPDARFADRFNCALTRSPCSLSLEPNLGVSVAFGR